MKKTLAIVSLLVAFCFTAGAEDTFYPGFQWGIKGGIGYTVGETSDFGKLVSPAAGINLGYQFTPVFTLRADIAGWQGKGIFMNRDPWTMNYAHLAADAVFDICNMARFKANRVVNPYFFAGIGAHLRFNNKADNSNPGVTIPLDNYYWSGSKVSYVYRFGVGVNFRVCDVMGIFVEVADNATDDKFNSKKGDYFDQQFTGMVGLKFTIAQARKAKAAAIAAASAAEAAAQAAAAKAAAEKAAAEKAAAEKAAAEKAAAERAAAEKAAAEAAAAKAAAEKAIADAAAAKAAACEAAIAAAKDNNNNIYFVIGKHDIGNAQKAKIDRIVKKLKANPEAKVTLCGFADKSTGVADRNMVLSENRANEVAKAIEAKGISADRIITYWFGDTVQVSKTPYKNRVCVMVSE